MAKSERKKLVARLDKVFSEYIRQRDGACVICGKRDRLTAGHLFTRTAYSTRWDVLNTHCQCTGCNLRHETDWVPFETRFKDKYGEEEFDKLYKKHHTTVKYSNGRLVELIEYWKGRLAKLKGE